jgi:dipeptidyl aminopeptidase/acylaminoacyl peptidase
VKAGTPCYVLGGSGGGGNTLALAGKAPDFFAAAVAYAGMSDYALWYRQDMKGAYRDEMDVWISGSPDSNPQGYQSRGGLHVLHNVLTDLLVIHGRNDRSVPFEHAAQYQAEARKLGKTNISFLFSDKGHASEPGRSEPCLSSAPGRSQGWARRGNAIRPIDTGPGGGSRVWRRFPGAV